MNAEESYEEVSTRRPSISVCVITVEKRATAFAKLLEYLAGAVARYDGDCELVVANNGGREAHARVASIVEASALPTLCPCRVVDSPRNNIATGRNLAVESARHELIAFIDDDEFPEPQWLIALTDVILEYRCDIVAGPILPVYAPSTAAWVRTIDLHNVRGLNTGEMVRYAASGNFLLDRAGVPELRFDEAYGTSGGSDTELFLRLGDAGAVMLWAAEAIVHEDIPANRSTVRATLRRCLAQGSNYRRILDGRGEIGTGVAFALRGAAVFAVSLPIGLLLVTIGHPSSGTWMKRAFSNLGKVTRDTRPLYG